MSVVEAVSGWSDRSAIAAWLAERAAAPDETLDLATMALALGALDRSPERLAGYARHLDEIGLAASRRAGGDDPSLAERVAAVNGVLFGQFGYDGDRDSYDDLGNANLLSVIDRRRGLPIALSILFLHAARRCRWPAEGVNFPGHFLVRMARGGESVILDPFEGGAMRDTAALRRLVRRVLGDKAEPSPEHLARASNRAILLRLENNIKTRRLRGRDYEGALAAVERMQLVAPENPGLWHDAALINVELGRLQRAIACLDAARSFDRDGRLGAEAAALRQRLSARLN